MFSHGGLEITRGENLSTGRKPSSENWRVVLGFFLILFKDFECLSNS